MQILTLKFIEEYIYINCQTISEVNRLCSSDENSFESRYVPSNSVYCMVAVVLVSVTRLKLSHGALHIFSLLLVVFSAWVRVNGFEGICPMFRLSKVCSLASLQSGHLKAFIICFMSMIPMHMPFIVHPLLIYSNTLKEITKYRWNYAKYWMSHAFLNSKRKYKGYL